VPPELHVTELKSIVAMPPLSPWQQSIWDSKKHNWMLFAGRRKGKSRVCWQKGVQFGLNGKNTVWYCASRDLANENWQDVVSFCRPFATSVNEVNDGSMTFVNPDKGVGRFKRRTVFGIAAGRAGKTNFLILDEGQLMAKQVFVRSRPSLLTTHGRTAITLTPPESPNEFASARWLQEVVEMSDDHGNCPLPGWGNWLVTKSPTFPEDIAFVMRQEDLLVGIERPKKYYINLAVDSLDEDREIMGQDDYDREYNLRWSLKTDALVYDNFRDGFHCNENFVFMPDAPVFWCADRGEGFAKSVILFFNRIQIGERNGIKIWKYRFFDEVATSRLMTEDELFGMALELTKKNNYQLPNLVFYDPRAPGLRLAASSLGLSAYSCNVGIEPGIRVVRRLLEKDLFEMHPRCRLMRDNILTYRRDDKGNPVDHNNDAMDALRYGTSQSEKLDGYVNSIVADNREIVNSLGRNTSSVMLLRL